MNKSIGCPVCSAQIKLGLSTSKKGKRSISLRCPVSGIHFRGFINDKDFVARFVEAAQDDG